MNLTSGLTIARIRGIEIRVHPSWLLVFVLITWVLAVNYESLIPDATDGQRWAYGLITSALFFLSVLLHEFSHAVVAQGFGMTVPSITLFIFGGVSNILGEMRRPRQEFFIAAAGPGMSFALGFIFLAAAVLTTGDVTVILTHIGIVNFVLGVFNLLPGFPLDGGRVFRSIVWARTNDLARATRIAAGVGQGIAWVMIGLGIVIVLLGSLLGLWYVLIGLFLKSAAEGAYGQMVVERALSGLTVARVMRPAPDPVAESTTLQQIVDERVLGRGERCVLLDRDGNITGLITTTDLQRAPRDHWATMQASEVMVRTEDVVTVAPHGSLAEAARTMAEKDVHQLPVIDGGHLVGLLTRGDILNHLETRSKFADLSDPVSR